MQRLRVIQQFLELYFYLLVNLFILFFVTIPNLVFFPVLMSFYYIAKTIYSFTITFCFIIIISSSSCLCSFTHIAILYLSLLKYLNSVVSAILHRYLYLTTFQDTITVEVNSSPIYTVTHPQNFYNCPLLKATGLSVISQALHEHTRMQEFARKNYVNTQRPPVLLNNVSFPAPDHHLYYL